MSDTWTCGCGLACTWKYCPRCGKPQPEPMGEEERLCRELFRAGAESAGDPDRTWEKTDAMWPGGETGKWYRGVLARARAIIAPSIAAQARAEAFEEVRRFAHTKSAACSLPERSSLEGIKHEKVGFDTVVAWAITQRDASQAPAEGASMRITLGADWAAEAKAQARREVLEKALTEWRALRATKEWEWHRAYYELGLWMQEQRDASQAPAEPIRCHGCGRPLRECEGLCVAQPPAPVATATPKLSAPYDVWIAPPPHAKNFCCVFDNCGRRPIVCVREGANWDGRCALHDPRQAGLRESGTAMGATPPAPVAGTAPPARGWMGGGTVGGGDPDDADRYPECEECRGKDRPCAKCESNAHTPSPEPPVPVATPTLDALKVYTMDDAPVVDWYGADEVRAAYAADLRAATADANTAARLATERAERAETDAATYRSRFDGLALMLTELAGVDCDNFDDAAIDRAFTVLKAMQCQVADLRAELSALRGKGALRGQGALPVVGEVVEIFDADGWRAHKVDGHTDYSDDVSNHRKPGFTVEGRAGIFGLADESGFWRRIPTAQPEGKEPGR